MKTISILTLRNALVSSIADAREVFSLVNEFIKVRGKEDLFKIQLVGITELTTTQGLFSVIAETTIDKVNKTDLVIIPALYGDMITATHLNKEYASWIVQQYKNGAEVAALSTGSFLLAFSGLLKNKQSTTHWVYANEFRHFYPLTSVVDENLITDQNGLYTSGGGSAYWNLLLHLIEKYTNRELSIQAAKYFVIDLDKTKQSPFIIFHGLKDHDDEMVLKAQEFIEQNYPERLTVEDLAHKFNTVRRTFERRFKKATRNTVTQYLQRVRIEAVKKQLELGRKNIQEIMIDVGYSDIQAFREIFKKITGMTPFDYKRKYSHLHY
jgi:transcriptional regulator GlxA family with amidase domain